MIFKKASDCASSSCVEVARSGEWVFVRDSKDFPDRPPLRFTGAEWSAFLKAAKRGEFDNAE